MEAPVQRIERAIAAASGQEVAIPERARGGWLTRRQAFAGGTAAAIAGGSALVGWQTGLIGSAKAQTGSIAVLPFKNLSGDPSQAYLTEGLTEEIRSALGRNSRLRVLAATSSNLIRDLERCQSNRTQTGCRLRA